MLKHNNIQEDWASIDQHIQAWLKERQELILLMVAIKGLHHETLDTPLEIRVKAFCQVLVDYVSAGHFEIYEELLHEAEAFNDGSAPLMRQKIPFLQRSTDAALDFNDFYDDNTYNEEQRELLPIKLSRLGEMLEERFEIEDELIDALHNSHRSLVA